MNQKVLGGMKDELGGQLGIGPKNYAFAFLSIDGKMNYKSICKGIPKSYTPKFFEYLDVVEGRRKDVKIDCFRIGSKEHDVFTIKTNKVAMTNEVRKRIRDPITKFETLLFGAEHLGLE